jgi:hypothetical protein
MEDKWFVFWEEPSLFFHRSWTGDCVFQLRLKPYELGYAVDEAWVNRDPEQYNSGGKSNEIKLISNLIEHLLLDNQ